MWYAKSIPKNYPLIGEEEFSVKVFQFCYSVQSAVIKLLMKTFFMFAFVTYGSTRSRAADEALTISIF